MGRAWMAVGAAVLGLVAVVTPAGAQEREPRAGSSQPLFDAVLACRSETDPQARLQCFDRTSGALATAAQSGAVVVVDREEVRRTRRSLFGFSLPRLPFFRGDTTAAHWEATS